MLVWFYQMLGCCAQIKIEQRFDREIKAALTAERASQVTPGISHITQKTSTLITGFQSFNQFQERSSVSPPLRAIFCSIQFALFILGVSGTTFYMLNKNYNYVSQQYIPNALFLIFEGACTVLPFLWNGLSILFCNSGNSRQMQRDISTIGQIKQLNNKLEAFKNKETYFFNTTEKFIFFLGFLGLSYCLANMKNQYISEKTFPNQWAQWITLGLFVIPFFTSAIQWIRFERKKELRAVDLSPFEQFILITKFQAILNMMKRRYIVLDNKRDAIVELGSDTTQRSYVGESNKTLLLSEVVEDLPTMQVGRANNNNHRSSQAGQEQDKKSACLVM